MKHKTAVEYLEESLTNLESQRDQLWSGLYLEWLKNIIEQAKKIEKQQIIDAHLTGQMCHLQINTKQSEQYYNDNFT